MSKPSTAKLQLISWVFILIQAILLALIIFLKTGKPILSDFEIIAANILKILGFAGLAISAWNLGKSLTALPDPKSNAKLETGGLYKYVRHPMYTSVLLLCFGIAGSSGSILKTILCVMLAILFVFKARYEEGLLLKKYKGYASYAKKTPMFLPLRINQK